MAPPVPEVHPAASRDGGFVAGLEALAFGVLVFVFGTLIVVNAWAIVDAKFATNSAAREAVRAVIETAGSGLTDTVVEERARLQAQRAASSHGFAPSQVLVRTGEIGRCGGDAVSIEVQVTIASLLVPGVDGWGDRTIASTHAELLDPFRSNLPC